MLLGGDREDIRPGADATAGGPGLRYYQPSFPTGQDIACSHYSLPQDYQSEGNQTNIEIITSDFDRRRSSESSTWRDPCSSSC